MKIKVDPTTLGAETSGGKSLRVKHILSATSGKTLNVVPQTLYELSQQVVSGERVLRTSIPSAFLGARDAPSLQVIFLLKTMCT